MERGRNLLAVVPGSFVSGAELLLLRDLDAARSAGWGVRVACSDGPLVERLAHCDIERIAIPDLRLGEGPKPLAAGRLASTTLGAARALRRDRRSSELLLVNGVNALPAAVLARQGRPVVLFAHDVLVRRDRLTLARLARRAVRGAIAVSDATAQPLRALGMNATVARQGTEWPVAPAQPSAEPVRIGIAAALSEWKGHRVVLDAVARMEHREVALEIMGAAPPKERVYEAELRIGAAQPALDGRVHFLGFVADPLTRMRTWTAAVVASTEPEAGPLVALEAMSIGVPVVATDHGGVREVLGDAGVLVPAGNAAALANALDRLLGDAVLYARCRAAGPPRIVDEHLTRAEHEQRFVAALDELSGAASA
ncbi:MAG TPA: glycosyltransferase family 4 protein [Acidimicrobiia bacterium]|jgi:glycosyltransferase involved in cell wall biosynthesis